MNGLSKVVTALGLIGIGCAGLGGVESATAQITPSGGGYIFHQKYVKGQKMTFVMTGNVVMAGLPAGTPGAGNNSYQSEITQEVIEVKNKIATVKVSTSEAKMSGKVVQPASSVIIQIDDQGKSVGGVANSPLQFIAPNRPLKIGESFSNSVAPKGAMGTSVTATYKFLGIKTVNGKPAAQFVITSTAKGPMQLAMNGTMLLDMADGQTISSKSATKMSAKQGTQSMNMSMTVSIVRK